MQEGECIWRWHLAIALSVGLITPIAAAAAPACPVAPAKMHRMSAAGIGRPCRVWLGDANTGELEGSG